MIAVVPLRKGSKGIKDKNIKSFCGKPLCWWTLQALQNSQISKVVVATDSTEYTRVIDTFNFSKVEVYHRDSKNATDTSSTESVLLEVIQVLDLSDADIMLVQATSPLTTFEDINKGITLYNTGNYESILSAVLQKRFIWSQDGVALNYDYTNRPRRQDWQGVFVENGAFYINSAKNIKHSNNRLSGKIGICPMSEETYYEIDSEEDWLFLETIYKLKE